MNVRLCRLFTYIVLYLLSIQCQVMITLKIFDCICYNNNPHMDISDNLGSKNTHTNIHGSIQERIISWYRALPDKKRYLEFITALLTIPVLLTVLLSNVTNLQNQNKTNGSTHIPILNVTPTLNPPAQNSIISGTTPPVTPSLTRILEPQCTPGVGPISIVYPEEGDTVMDNPLCLEISRKNSNYCAISYSYRINNGAWSAFFGNSVCMSHLTPGTKRLDLRIRSTVNDDEEVFTRTFIIADPSPSPATQSSTVQ